MNPRGLSIIFLAVVLATACGSVVTSGPDVQSVLDAIFSALKVTGVDTQACVSDVGGSNLQLRNFGQALAAKKYVEALSDLGGAATALATAVNGCGVPQVQARLDAIAGALSWVKISTNGFDQLVSIVVGASDLTLDISALGVAVSNSNGQKVGVAIGKLLVDWTHITGGCRADKACTFLDGIMRVLQVAAPDVSACRAGLAPAYAKFLAASMEFNGRNYQPAVAAFAAALDVLATAIGADACGLRPLSAAIAKSFPALQTAITSVDASGAVKIMVGSSNVYDALFHAVTAWQKDDTAAFGMAMGSLLQQLRASGCQSPACLVIQSVLAAAQLEANDLVACSRDAENAWSDMMTAWTDATAHNWAGATQELGSALKGVSLSVSACGVPQLSAILQDLATKLGSQSTASLIGETTQVLVTGSDATLLLAQMHADFKAGRYTAVGTELNQLAAYLAPTVCHNLVCELTNGLLLAAGEAMQDLQVCEADLHDAVAQFVGGAQAFGQRDVGSGVKGWASGLSDLAKAVAGCGLQRQLGFIQNEANVLGVANVTSALGAGLAVLVHGSDVYQDMFAVYLAINAHDYRSAGAKFKKVMDELLQWTQGHACTSPFCYATVGILEFMGNVEGDIRNCQSDFELAWHNLTGAYQEFSSRQGGIFHWVSDATAIQRGVGDVGAGLTLVSRGVGDCHLQEFADLLAMLAAKFGLNPYIGWIETALHIIINGVHIENELGLALTDFSQENWVGFGYNLAQLIKTLL